MPAGEGEREAAISTISTEIDPIAYAMPGEWSDRDFLAAEIKYRGLTDCDQKILTEIIQCESGWRHYGPSGSPQISNGNIGLAQINYWAHHAEYEALGLDVNRPFGNIAYAVILYEREGVAPWAPWSGHCFLPRIADCLGK